MRKNSSHQSNCTLKAQGAAGTFQSFAHTGVAVLKTTLNNKIRLEVEWFRQALTPQKTLVVAIKKFWPLAIPPFALLLAQEEEGETDELDFSHLLSQQCSSEFSLHDLTQHLLSVINNKKWSMLSFNVIKVSAIASAKPFWFVFLYKSFSLNLV